MSGQRVHEQLGLHSIDDVKLIVDRPSSSGCGGSIGGIGTRDVIIGVDRSIRRSCDKMDRVSIAQGVVIQAVFITEQAALEDESLARTGHL